MRRHNPARIIDTTLGDIVRLCSLALIGLIALVAGSCARERAAVTLDIATTTSVRNSGLLEALLPRFAEATVRVHAAGSGRALEMMNDGIVDLVISHAPEAEARTLAEHPDWTYRKLAFNRFVVVGPPADPAGVKQTTSVLDAFRRIAAAPVDFVSRGDASGTDEREQQLWQRAGVTPSRERLLVSGRGMAITLRQAHEQQAYTLTDEATFWQLQEQLDLVVLSEGDELLLNTYAVIHPRDSETGGVFAEWLTTGEGRRLIEGHRIAGRAAFHVWPASCPADSPNALPCR